MGANSHMRNSNSIPACFVARESLIKDARNYLENTQKRYPQQSVIYYGLRGVGKTALLNTIEETADHMGILHARIEANEDKEFAARLICAFNCFLHDISLKAPAEDFTKKCAELIESFMITYDIKGRAFNTGEKHGAGVSIGIFSDDITEISVALGKAALKSGDTIVLFIDEVQHLTGDELKGVIAAIHRCNQLRLPIMLFCAGLPEILKTAGKTCSYAERLFKFELVGTLTEPAMKAAASISKEENL